MDRRDGLWFWACIGLLGAAPFVTGCSGSVAGGGEDRDRVGDDGDGNGVDDGPSGDDGPGPEACVERGGRPPWQLAPHTKFQVRTIVGQVFGAAALDDAQVKSMLANLPLDLKAKHFDSEARTLSSQYLDAYTGLVRRLSGLAAEQVSIRRAMEDFAGKSCAGTLELDAGCGREFARTFADAFMRAPMPDEDFDFVMTAYGENKAGYQAEKAYAGFVASMLLGARSALRVDNAEREQQGEIDIHDLGARLSLVLTSALPDQGLREKIADGSLREPDVLREEAQRLLRSDLGRATLNHFARQWLNVAMLKSPPGRDGFVKTSEDSALMAEAAGDEIGRLFEATVLGGGTLRDFYTTEDVVPTHDWLSQLYGMPMGNELTRAGDTRRKGLLSRAAFHLHGAFADWLPLAHRGYGVKVTMLCGTVPPIPDNVDFSLPDDAPEVLSSSEYFKELTERGFCASCHAAINPYAYPLSGFSVTGQYMTRETVKNRVSGEVLEVDIDETGMVEIDGESFAVKGAEDLSRVIGESAEGQACFQRRFAQYAVGAEEDAGCINRDSAALDRSLEDTILAHVSSAAFGMR